MQSSQQTVSYKRDERVKGWTLDSLEREVLKDKASTISFLRSRGVLPSSLDCQCGKAMTLWKNTS